MNQEIEALNSTTFCGKRCTRKQLTQIQDTIKMFPNLNRRELARTICENLRWYTPRGTYKEQYCLSVLREMEEIGLIMLPAIKIEMQRKTTQKSITLTDRTKEQANITCSLDDLGNISVQKVTEKEDINLWNEFVDRYHYLGYKRPIGSHIRYFIVSNNENKNTYLGCLLFSFAVRSLPCRDDWIGWKGKDHQKHLNLILNNTRFLIFPWVSVKLLASKALSIISQQIANDWEEYHGYRPVLLETFIDPTIYKGTCYKAANWEYIGKTAGHKLKNSSNNEKSQKDFYVYPLNSDFRSILKNEKKTTTPIRTSPLKITEKIKDLTSDDPYIQLWQKIISLVINVANEFDKKWQKRNRVINTMLLILFIFRLVISKNKQGYGCTIVELWDQCHIMHLPLPQSKPVAPSAFCKARSKLDACIFKELNTKIIDTYENNATEYNWKSHRLFAVDGTKINLPRQLCSSGYKRPSDNAYYPQGLASCLYQVKSKIPYDFYLVAHKDERKVALSHLQILRPNDVVAYDRGYFSYAMAYYHIKREVHAVFRLQKNANKVIEEFFLSNDTDKVVVIEPTKDNQRDIMSKHPDIVLIPIKVRLIKYFIAGKPYILATTLLDRNLYKAEDLIEVYHSRWGVEELYKVSKILIDVEDFHGQKERGIQQELYAHFVLITLNRIFANKAEDNFYHNDNCSNQNENSDTKNKFKANFKNCLLTIARNLELLFIQQISLVTNTVNKIISFIECVRQKERPNRSYKRQSKKPVKKWRPSKSKKVATPATT